LKVSSHPDSNYKVKWSKCICGRRTSSSNHCFLAKCHTCLSTYLHTCAHPSHVITAFHASTS